MAPTRTRPVFDWLSTLLRDLRERRAVRFLAGYIVAAWVAAQVIGFFVEQGYLGRRVLDVTLFLLAVLFLVCLVLVWYHGERGQQRVQRTEAIILSVLAAVALGGSAWLSFRGGDPGQPAPPAEAVVDLGDRSVAVLPFQNQLDDPELEWLDRGVADLLATDLAQLPALRVVSGQRVVDLLRQLGAPDSRLVPDELRTRLTQMAGARYMLTGRIVGSASNLVLVASLEDAHTGEIMVAARHQGPDVFQVVDDVSGQLVTEALAPGSGLGAPVSELTTSNLAAYEQYEQGRRDTWAFRARDARERFEAAVALDSTFAIAHLQLAGVHANLGAFPASLASLAAAQRHLRAAGPRDQLFIEALAGLIRGDTETAEVRLETLVAQYPTDKEAILMLANVKRNRGKPAEHIALLESVLRLDPSYASAYNELAYGATRRGDADSAIALADRYVALLPDEPNPLDTRGEVFEMAGRYDEARSSYLAAIEYGFPTSVTHLGRTYLREDRATAGLEALAPYSAPGHPVDLRTAAHRAMARLHLWDGDFEQATAAYGEAIAVAAEAGDGSLRELGRRTLALAQVQMGHFDEALALAEDILAESGEPLAFLVGAVVHAERNDRAAYSALVDRFDRLFRDDPTMAPMVPFMSSVFRSIEAHRDGEYGRTVEIAAGAPMVVQGGIEYLGFPVIRSMLALGDGARAFAQLDVARRSGIVGPPPVFPFNPEVERHLQYFEARALELNGNPEDAAALYSSLLDAWGERLESIPWMADTRTRYEALTQP